MESSKPASPVCRCMNFGVFAVPEWGRKDFLLSLKNLMRKIIPVVLSKMRAAGFFIIPRLILICIIGFVFHNPFAAEYIVPKKPVSADVADIDLDGDLDIVLGHKVNWGYSDPAITILSNQYGNFVVTDTIDFCGNQVDIKAQKLDQDNFPDIVSLMLDFSSEIEERYVRIVYNHNGIFNEFYDLSLNTEMAISGLEIIDIDNDHNFDISLISHEGQLMGLLYNYGTGQFSPPTYYNLNYHPTGLACGDLNGNGREDILVSAVYHLDAWLNGDSGLVYTNISDTARAYRVKIADLDNDGYNDIVGYDWGMPGTPKRFLIYSNDGNGSFTLSYAKWINEAMAQTFVSDLNNDSFPDIIYNVSYSYPNSNDELFHTYILFNNQDGTFQDPVNYYTGICSHKSYAADLDGNGWNDIITLNYDFYNPPPDTGTIHILFNDGTGNFVEYPVVGLVEDEPPITSGYKLYQNYPNPFNGSTTIAYYLEKTANTELAIYNINGQLIKTITHEQERGGMHSVRWDATNSAGKEVSSGVYVYTLRVDKKVIAREMLLIR
jgi:hypothetical protein